MIRIKIILLIVLVTILMSGCSGNSMAGMDASITPAYITYIDDLQRPVAVKLPVDRIISMAPSNTEILFDVGAGDQVVGRDSFSDYPSKASLIQDIGGSMGQYNFEAIAALEPDLVLAAEINTPEQVHSMESLGLTVYYLANPVDFNGLYANIRTVGRLSGHDVEADALASSLAKRVAKIETEIAGVTSRPSIYYELDATDPARPYTLGAGTFGDTLISMAGGVNIGSAIGEGWVQISGEEILRSNPDLILLGDVYAGVTPESVSERPGWDVLEAVISGKVIPFDDDLISRPTARLVDGLEELAALFHPEILQD